MATTTATASITFDSQPPQTNKAISSLYGEYLKNGMLNLSPSYQRDFVWNSDQQSALIDTIMTNCPMPIFLLYMYYPEDDYECIDGQNRLTTIREYIEQDPTNTIPFAWIIITPTEEIYVYYNNEATRSKMEAYCETQNKKKRRGLRRTHRLMTKMEQNRFHNYQLVLSEIKTKLTVDQRKDIFMRWQNGTTISRCDAYKNKDYVYCKYISQHNVNKTLVKNMLGKLIKTNNWVYDVYRLFTSYKAVEQIQDSLLCQLQIEAENEREDEGETNYRDLQTKLEQLLVKLKPLEPYKNAMYITFLLGYIYLYRKASPSVRLIAEKKEFLENFANYSLKEVKDRHMHNTLNNTKNVKAFADAFPVFTDDFYVYIDKYRDVPLVTSNTNQTSNNTNTNTNTNKKKESIPNSLKTDVWNKYIGIENGESPCPCCRTRKINQREFHAGHVIPEKDGGPTTVENLRPICAPCNLSMGTQNMRTFIQKHYPASYALFT